MENATQAQDGQQPQQGQADPQQGASARAALVDSAAKAAGVASICNADI